MAEGMRPGCGVVSLLLFGFNPDGAMIFILFYLFLNGCWIDCFDLFDVWLIESVI